MPKRSFSGSFPGYYSTLRKRRPARRRTTYSRARKHYGGRRVVFGFGAYSVFANSFMDMKGVSTGVPRVKNHAGETRITHREFVGPVVSSATAGAFTNEAFVIQPGLGASFPWLSLIAHAFSSYRLKGMLFEFVSSSGDSVGSTNTALGSVIMATNYNSNDAEYATLSQMLNSEYSVAEKPSRNIRHYIECGEGTQHVDEYFVRSNAVLESGQNSNLYDFATFQIASNGCPGAGVTLGNLYVSYDIELLKPQVEAAPGSQILSASWALTLPTTAAYFPGTITEIFNSIPNFSISDTTASTFTLPRGLGGVWSVTYYVQGSVPNAAAAYPTVACANATEVACWGNPTYGRTEAGIVGAGVLNAEMICMTTVWAIVDASLPSVFQFSAGAFPTVATAGNLFISQVNPNMNNTV